ncbi:hypothetical protein AB9P05_09180 [Roseivirga sp. BDSF3-8]|uniref:hypothetical protein n=1 Tax=Roseivirga sp. BDSF3-8 TaxID=3241598 RepID=UPI0035320D2B
MNITFDELSPDARVWIFQADRKLETSEQQVIDDETALFVRDWKAHGKPLKAASRLYYDQFLVIALDEKEQEATGCAIDTSVAFIRELEKALQVNFFDRSKVAIMRNDEVMLENLKEIKDKVDKGHITEDTPVFNNLVDKKKDLDNQWVVPAKKSWLNRYF